MPTLNEKEYASMVEYSVTEYQHFLAALNHNRIETCTLPDHILCLGLYFRFITFKQFQLLFPLKTSEMIRITLTRLVNKRYLSQPEEIKLYQGYTITPEGCAYIKKKLPALMKAFLPETLSSEAPFKLSDILDYIETRLTESRKPSYWFHYFGIRDFYFSFLSNSLTCSDFLFLQECPVIKGRPVSLYKQSLKHGRWEDEKELIRSDGLLASCCPSNRELDIPLFLEFDTGSQRSSVLTNKVSAYLKSSQEFFKDYLRIEGMKVHMPPSVVFCISSKHAGTKLPSPSKSLGKRKYRAALTRASEIYLFLKVLDEAPFFVKESRDTLSSCISLFSSVEKRLALSSSADILPQLLAYKEKYPEDLSRSVSELLNEMEVKKESEDDSYKLALNHHYLSYYEDRKALLYKSIHSVETEQHSSLFLNGFSIFTVCHELLPAQLPYLIPELYWYSASLKSHLSDFNCYPSLRISYEHLGKAGNRYTFRNSYTITDEEGVYQYFVENISDDYGGNLRVRHFLALKEGNVTAPVKIICITSLEYLQKNYKIFTGSLLYKMPGYRISSVYDKTSLEILFCTPEDFENGKFFVITREFDIIYKG